VSRGSGSTGSLVRHEHVAHVEADDLGQAQAGAEREGNDRVVAHVSGGRAKD
jgi:hypothetical protein